VAEADSAKQLDKNNVYFEENYMWILIIIIVVAIVLYLRRTNSPKGMASSISKVMMNSLRLIGPKLAQENPDISVGEIYLSVIMLRPGYDERRAIDILKDAKKMSEQVKGHEFNFQSVVTLIVIQEFSKNRTTTSQQQLDTILNTVKSTIPANL